MIIRPADLDKDALAIFQGAKDFAKFSGLNLFPDNEEDFLKAVSRIITLENIEILVAEHENEIVGGIGIVFSPFTWNPSIIIGEELFWWAFENAPMKTGKKLYNEAMKNIEEKNAIPMFRSLKNSPDSVKKLYISDGLTELETSWMRLP